MSTAEAEVVEQETTATPGRELAIIEPPSHDKETVARIVELNNSVTKARLALDRITIKKKAAQEVLTECQARLNDFISEIGREYPLFDGVTADGEIRESKPEPPDPESIADRLKDAGVTEITPDLEARTEPIGRLHDHGLSMAIVTKLLEAGIPSIGALADWTATPPKGKGMSLTQIPHIGFTRVEKINEALDKFWRSRLGPVDVEAELAEGCKEVEKVKGEKSKGDPAWRYRPVENLGLSDRIVKCLLGAGMTSAEDVAHRLASNGDFTSLHSLLDEADENEIEAALSRFRNSLSNAQIWDYEAFMEEAQAEGAEGDSDE